MALLAAGSFLPGAARLVMWTVAALIDYAGPAWLTRERLRGLPRVAVAHVAERYGLFVIICLGESIVAIGLAASRRAPDGELIAAVALGLVITIGLWWTYFDQSAASAEERLRRHDDPVLAAADAYSYLHLVVVAGIIVFAVGIRLAVQDPGAPLSEGGRLVLCGGVALYLAGHAAFRARLLGATGWGRLAAAVAAMVVFAAGGGVAAWVVAAALSAVLATLCAAETSRGRRPAA